ncbi:MAG: hypothetical protein ABSC92_03140 [Rhizomicrobium sp.]|jgi:hypothetical protein
MTGTILYATALLPVEDACARISRQRQSAAARNLQELLETSLPPKLSSRSHSRAAVAATVGDAQILALGIDIEFMEQSRPFAALAGFLTKFAPAHLGADEFYRCWTFAEAYFKAFQRLPPDLAIHSVGTQADPDGTYQLPDGTHLLHRRIADCFQLCLVWRLSIETCDLQYISAPA